MSTNHYANDPKFLTVTMVLRADLFETDIDPDDLQALSLAVMGPEAIMFHHARRGVSDQAISLGAEPEGWGDEGDLDEEDVTLYQKCKDCHLFVEKNGDHRPGNGLAEYLHLHRDDAADRLIDESHEARPSGLIATLDTWKACGPMEMRQRFDDYNPTGQPHVLFTDDGSRVTVTTHPNEQAALDCLRLNFAKDERVDDEDLVQYVCDQGVVVYIISI